MLISALQQFDYLCVCVCVCVCAQARMPGHFSCVWLFAIPWTVACQAPLSVEFSRQEYWDGLPFPSPGNLPKPGNEPGSPSLQADSLPSEPLGKPICMYMYIFLFVFFSIIVHLGYWMYFHVLYSRTLFIHPVYNSLHLLIPNSQSIPPSPLPVLATTSLFSMSVTLFLFCR